jgi:hypothetical protein
MWRGFQTSLILLAALSATLAGTFAPPKIARADRDSIQRHDGRYPPGSRENDTGMPAEESEEEDVEKQEGREVHLMTPGFLTAMSTASRFFTPFEAAFGKPRHHRLAAPIRGPPLAA